MKRTFSWNILVQVSRFLHFHSIKDSALHLPRKLTWKMLYLFWYINDALWIKIENQYKRKIGEVNNSCGLSLRCAYICSSLSGSGFPSTAVQPIFLGEYHCNLFTTGLKSVAQWYRQCAERPQCVLLKCRIDLPVQDGRKWQNRAKQVWHISHSYTPSLLLQIEKYQPLHSLLE